MKDYTITFKDQADVEHTVEDLPFVQLVAKLRDARQVSNVKLSITTKAMPRMVKLNFFALLAKSLPNFWFMLGRPQPGMPSVSMWNNPRPNNSDRTELFLTEYMNEQQWGNQWFYHEKILTLEITGPKPADVVAGVAIRLVNLLRFFKVGQRRRYLTPKKLSWASFNAVTATLSDFGPRQATLPDQPQPAAV